MSTNIAYDRMANPPKHKTVPQREQARPACMLLVTLMRCVTGAPPGDSDVPLAGDRRSCMNFGTAACTHGLQKQCHNLLFQLSTFLRSYILCCLTFVPGN